MNDRNPEDNTGTETLRTTTHLGVGPETGLHPSDPTPEPTVTPEEAYADTTPAVHTPDTGATPWLWIGALVLVLFILYLILR
jgi:hypothetical protein